MPQITFDQLKHHSASIMALDNLEQVIEYLEFDFLPEFEYSDAPASWYYGINCLIASLDERDPYFQIFALKGNSKLPFANFSTLPAITCPGMGDCFFWCYSFRAWRNAGAFLRQLQNTILLKFLPELIVDAWIDLPEELAEFRLYVDGDFDSKRTLEFWFDLLRIRPEINCYGYTKSWHLFLEHAANGKPFPGNYLVNISSGSKFENKAGFKSAMLALECTRGEFVGTPVVNIGQYGKGFKRYASKQYHQTVRDNLREERGIKKVISCPGECGSCGAGKHFCGDRNLKDVVIAIGIH